jgi:hypothetical protein
MPPGPETLLLRSPDSGGAAVSRHTGRPVAPVRHAADSGTSSPSSTSRTPPRRTSLGRLSADPVEQDEDDDRDGHDDGE